MSVRDRDYMQKQPGDEDNLRQYENENEVFQTEHSTVDDGNFRSYQEEAVYTDSGTVGARRSPTWRKIPVIFMALIVLLTIGEIVFLVYKY